MYVQKASLLDTPNYERAQGKSKIPSLVKEKNSEKRTCGNNGSKMKEEQSQGLQNYLESLTVTPSEPILESNKQV